MARVSVEYKDHIAHVTLTRADKMNALDDEMIKAIIAAAEEVAASKARAVVLTGEGKGFCAGLDLMSFAKMGQMDPEQWLMARSHGDGNEVQAVAMAWRQVPVPVIAAVNGVCFGGGLQLALGADIRVAAPDARFSVMEMKWGIVPDMGGMALLPRLVRSDILRRLTYTAEVFEAPQALDWGLLTEVSDDPLARAKALAAEIAGKNPEAIRAAKRLIDVAETADQATVLMEESREQVALIGRPNQMEAIAAQMQKRAPQFTD
jgi:enoyl-CoA hydratase/carnithine racemase